MDTTNLVSWLSFDESATADKCGNSWTAYGSPTIGTDGAINGKALQLDGASYLKMAESFQFTGQPFTIGCWFSGTSNTTGGAVCPWQMHIGSSNRIQLEIDTSGTLALWKDTDSTVWIKTNFSVLDGLAHYVECDFDGATWYLFLDGVLIGTQAHTCTARNYSLYVGTNYDANRKFTGTIDEFQIYDGVALHTENFTPPTADDYIQLTLDMGGGVAHVDFTADVERKVNNAAKIINSMKVWLPFDESPTLDKCGNPWTAVGSLAVEDGALALESSSTRNYIYTTPPELGMSDFTIDWWEYIPASVNSFTAEVIVIDGTTGSNTRCLSLAYWRSSAPSMDLGRGTGASWSYDGEPIGTKIRDQWVHRAVVRSGNTIYAFENGTLFTSRSFSYSISVSGSSLFIGNFARENRQFVGKLKNVRIYVGAALWTENFTPPTTDDYIQLALNMGGVAHVDFTADVERKVENTANLWRYFNKGTADTLTISGTTLTALPESQSKTGTAFVQTARQKCFDIPATPEIWLKFDVYFDGSNRWRAYNGGANGTTGITAQTNGTIYFFVNDNEITGIANAATKNQLQTVLLHMISGSTDGIVEAWVDGDFIYRYTGDVNHGDDFADIYLQTDGSGTFFSNVIISNGEIGLEEGWQIFPFDAERHLWKNFAVTFDVERKVRNTVHYEISADVVIRDILPVNFRADVERKIVTQLDFRADVEILDVINVEFIADIERNVSGNVEMFATDTAEYFSGGGSAPVVIPSQEIIPPATQNTDGLQSIEISIAAQQLTDQISIVGIVPFDVLNQVKGTYLDYNFDMRVALMKKQGILYHCDTCLDIDEILFTPLNYSLPSKEVSAWYTKKTVSESFFIFPEASKHVNKIAAALGLQPVMQFKDFYSTVEVGESEEDGASFNDLIRDIFGWSSRVPTEMINVFIREGCLFVIQRGYESNLIDISASKHTLPIVEHKLMRMFYQRKKFSRTQTRQRRTPRKSYAPNIPKEKPEDDKPDSGGSGGSSDDESPWLATGEVVTKDSEGTTVTTYYYTSDGVLMKTVAQFTSNSNQEENSTTTTSNYYNDDGTLSSTVVEVTHPQASEDNTKTVTTYGYMTLGNGKKFLSTEMIEKYSIGENGGYELEDTRITTKSPTGRGQGATTDDKGNSGASGNIGDDRVSPYSADNPTYDNPIYNKPNSDNAGGGGWDTIDEHRDIEGLTLIDTSFPIQNVSSEQFANLPWDWQEGNVELTVDGKPVAPGTNLEDIDTAKGVGRLRELTDAIKWLNRKIQETVTLTLYEFPHLINLNDRILLDGNIYFLENNVAKTTPRIFNEQALTLIRWF